MVVTFHRKLICPSILLLAVAASCTGGDDRRRPDDELPPVFPEIQRFDADRRVVLPGESVTLSYAVTNATYVSIEPGVVAPSSKLAGDVTTGPLEATTTFTLRATSDAGETTRNIVVTVQTETEARIVDFSADLAIVEPGGSVTLTWQTEGATRVSLSEVGGQVLVDQADLSGAFTVMPQDSTTYQLSAMRADETPVTAEVTVLVGRSPVIDAFTASPTQITTDPATLSWTVMNADNVSLRADDGTLMLDGLATSGSQVVTPQQTTAYMLLASNDVGTAVANLTVEVLPPGSARILTFEIAPETLAGPGQVQIDWETADADTVDLTADGVSVQTFPRTPSGTMTLDVGKTTAFELSAENGQGTTTDLITVTVGSPDTMAPIIQHVAVGDGQPEGGAIQVVATIMDVQSGVASATLFYRTEGTTTFASAAMTDEGNDRFRASIPAAAVVSPAVEYYILASDALQNAGTDPVGAPATLHRFTVTPDDQVAPTIVHTPIATEQMEGTDVTISADVTDATGVDGVTLYHRVQGAPMFTGTPMSNTAGSTYQAQISNVGPPGVEYYLEASDTIQPANLGRHPSNAPTVVHAFSVEALDLTPPAVTHTPIANGQQAGSPVTVTVDVTDPSGVGQVTLFYKQAGAGSYTSVPMNGANQTKVAQIPAGVVAAPRVDYYVEAVDMATPSANTARAPATAPGTPYSFTVSAIDSAPPTISHTSIQNGQPSGQPVTVSADVVDASGVSVVTLFYRTRGQGTYASAAMNGGPTYVTQIPAGAVQDPGVDYYIQATDASPQANGTTLPSGAPGSVFTFDTGTGESEPNGTPAQATPFLDGARLNNIGLASISSASDRDYWIVDVPAGANRYTVTLEITRGGVGICPSGDTRMRLYGSDGSTVLVQDDSDGIGSCSLIDPIADTGARALAPGRYYVSVEEDGNNSALGSYELRGSMQVAACGNGILETAAGEQCEDGNTASNDGCNASCQIEPEGTFSGTGGTQTGAISPAGDADVYAVVIGQGQYLTAETSDGSGGCSGDTVLELYEPDGVTLVGTDDDGGFDTCSRIDPTNDAWAAQMAAGTYFLRVRAYSSASTIPSYTLAVSIASNICGNSNIETGEQCDDGNSLAFDGCSATCQWETAGTAMGAGASFSESISPGRNVDWYAVVVPSGYSIRAETFAPTDGVCSSGNDTVVRLWQADRSTQITTDDDGGANRCSLLDPMSDTAARGLAAGTYYVSVEDYDKNDVISAYVLNIAIQAPVCGDGFVNGTEACDDGNAASGDGCSSACQFEGTGESEPNGTTATASPLITSGNLSGTVFGAIQTSGDVDVYSVVVPANHHLVAEVRGTDGGCTVDTTLRLRSPSGTSLVSDDSAGPGSCGRLAPGADSEVRSLSAGTYYLEVTRQNGSSIATYVLDARVLAPGCGDLYLSGTEACDDGNTISGDGCSATCQFELLEMEPNDTSSTAQPLGNSRMVSASIGAANERDWYAVTVPQGGQLHIATHDGAPDQCGSADTVVTLYDPSGTEVEEDDLDGPGLCSVIYRSEANGLSAGTYRIRVRPFSSSATFDYALTVEVQ